MCKKVDFFDYERLVRYDFTPPKFFNSVFLYGNYKAVATAQNKHFNFLTDYLEHGVCFINTVESARLLGYVDRRFIKNIYTYGPIRKKIIEQYLKQYNLERNIIEVGPYILGAQHFYTPSQLATLKKTYGKILLVYPQHSIESRVVHYELDDIIREIHARKGNFDSVFICLYWKDILIHPEYVQKYLSEGFIVVSNGHRSDPQFLSRQKDLIHLSNMMMTNGLGTHIGYSICMNKPVYFYKQTLQLEHIATNTNNTENELQLIESEFYTAFSEFSFNISEEQKNLVRQYWGS
jgi:hypothetical protein